MSRVSAHVVLPAIPGVGTKVEVGGFDLTNAVRAVRIDSAVGQVTELYLDLVILESTTFDGEVVVQLPDATHEALVKLGWTPPEGDR